MVFDVACGNIKMYKHSRYKVVINKTRAAQLLNFSYLAISLLHYYSDAIYRIYNITLQITIARENFLAKTSPRHYGFKYM